MPEEVFLKGDCASLFALFPAGIITDRAERVVETGPSLKRHKPQLTPGAVLREHFVCSVAGEEMALDQAAVLRCPIELVSVDGAIRLTGMIIAMPDGWFVAARHLPWQFTLTASQVQMSDFGPDDPAVAGLLLVGLQKAMLEEAQEAATELARERQRSQALLERISRVAGFMAHDFNNFLSIMRLNTQRILDDENCVPRIARLVGIIDDTAARGSEITRSLMTLSRQRYDSGALLSVDQLLRDHLAFMRTVVGSAVEIELELDASGQMVVTSRVAMLNCIINSLINARDAMPQGGTVFIVTGVRSVALGDGPERDYIALKISDSGDGMAPDVLSQAFEPMFSTKPQGNGFGLASILDFAREMGGDACIDSEPGQGTSLYMYLPVSADIAAEEGSQPTIPAERHERADQRPRILLIEDEPYALEALSEMIEQWGLSVTACASAEAAAQALEAPDAGEYQAVLCDVLLGTGSGIALCRAACARFAHLRIILMSGYVPHDNDIQPGWQFIRKPLDLTRLKELVTHTASAEAGPNPSFGSVA